MKGYAAKYGDRAVTAYPETNNGRYRYFTIIFHEDRGFGPMTEKHIYRTELEFTGEQPPKPEL